MSFKPKNNKGTLYIIATPIGNLEDITLRALRILKEVDYIAAEDTRHSKKLLNHYGISTQLISYYREKEKQRAVQIIKLLEEGYSVGLISDAGTPGISDPGSILVQRAVESSIRITPIPGTSALTAALSCAGTDEGSILFYGFAPAKKSQRRKLLHSLAYSDHHAVFYESPRRVADFIHDAHTILGDRKVFIARELTKNYEELIHSSLKKLDNEEERGAAKGEFVLVIGPTSERPSDEMDTDELIIWYRDNTSVSLKDCCKTLAADLGISKSTIYKRAIQLWKDPTRG